MQGLPCSNLTRHSFIRLFAKDTSCERVRAFVEVPCYGGTIPEKREQVLTEPIFAIVTQVGSG